MMNKETRMYDDPDLVEYRTDLEGWTGPDRLYYGKGPEGEHRARYANSTHKKCSTCGGIVEKISYCKVCQNKKKEDYVSNMEIVEWDGVSMLATYDDDRFFTDMDEVYEYCEEHDIEPKDLVVVICEKTVNISTVDIDELNEEYMTEDGNGVSHYHPEIAAKVAELNQLIKDAEPKLWFATNKRVLIK